MPRGQDLETSQSFVVFFWVFLDLDMFLFKLFSLLKWKFLAQVCSWWEIPLLHKKSSLFTIFMLLEMLSEDFLPGPLFETFMHCHIHTAQSKGNVEGGGFVTSRSQAWEKQTLATLRKPGSLAESVLTACTYSETARTFEWQIELWLVRQKKKKKASVCLDKRCCGLQVPVVD